MIFYHQSPVGKEEVVVGSEPEQDVDARLVLLVGQDALDRRHHGQGARAHGQHHDELGRVPGVGKVPERSSPEHLGGNSTDFTG